MPKGIYQRSEEQKLISKKKFQEQAALKKGKPRKPFSEETKRKMSESRKGKPPWNKGKTGIYSEESLEKIKSARASQKITEEHRRKLSESQKDNVKKGVHHLWRGGIYPKNLALRKSLEYKLWREAVFKRDLFSCVFCGNKKSGNLEADHIKPFSLYPELRFAIDNGRTLCKECHRATDTYGFSLRRSKDT
jgi:hypothetical protein